MDKFYVYFVNFGYESSREFNSQDDAVAYAKTTAFNVSITQGRSFTKNCKLVGFWSCIGGFRPYKG